MRIKKIKVHQSVHFCGRENLGFSHGAMPGFPKGIQIDYEPGIASFHVKHGEDSVFVTKENVPYFEMLPSVVETPSPKRGRPAKAVDELVDSVLQ